MSRVIAITPPGGVVIKCGSAHSRSAMDATIFAYQFRCRSNIDDDTAARLQHGSSRNIFGAKKYAIKVENVFRSNQLRLRLCL